MPQIAQIIADYYFVFQQKEFVLHNLCESAKSAAKK
jgi:hypothetical protein